MLDQCEQNDASCYGALRENPTDMCCPTCKDVKTAYANIGWNLAADNIIQCSGRFISRYLVIVIQELGIVIGNILCS